MIHCSVCQLHFFKSRISAFFFLFQSLLKSPDRILNSFSIILKLIELSQNSYFKFSESNDSGCSRLPAVTIMLAAARRHGWGCILHGAAGSWGQAGALALASWGRSSQGTAAATQTVAADSDFQFHGASRSPTPQPWAQLQLPKSWLQTQASLHSWGPRKAPSALSRSEVPAPAAWLFSAVSVVRALILEEGQGQAWAP